MTDLETLKAELARQDREFEACFEEMKGIDPDLQFAVSNETLRAFEDQPEETITVAPSWAHRV